jgi:hypothetical protein
VLGVGIDWAEAFHLVALGHPDEGVIQVLRVEHTPAAVDLLIAQIAALEAAAAEVRVVIETRHGLLVERQLVAGYTVLPVNPDLVARRRGPAGKKDDAEDARICCLLALDRHAALRPLIPHGEGARRVHKCVHAALRYWCTRALLHLARRCHRRVAEWSRFPVQTAVGSTQKQSILASPMAFRGSGGGRRFE